MANETQQNLFLKWLTKRVMKENLNATVIVEGEYTGVGKSYLAMYLSEEFHTAHKKELPPFTVENIFFEPENAMNFIGEAPQYSCGIYDDAGATAGHRNWFDEVMNILSTTVQTYRFRNLIMFITVPFGIQVDIDLRRLSNLSIVVHDRGYACVYKTTFQKFANKNRGAVYYNHLFDIGSKTNKKIRLPMPTQDLCTKYEKKKAKTFLEKWEMDKSTIISNKRQAEWMRLKNRTDDEIMTVIIQNPETYRNKDGFIDPNLVQYYAKVGFLRGKRIINLLDQVHGFR
ncbi:MAG TPA: hypothetical protein VMZ04_05220 [Anaerolineae bacterium]|nr:hypothetical protein [Anaerolineae bacterium]